MRCQHVLGNEADLRQIVPGTVADVLYSANTSRQASADSLIVGCTCSSGCSWLFRFFQLLPATWRLMNTVDSYQAAATACKLLMELPGLNMTYRGLYRSQLLPLSSAAVWLCCSSGL